MKQRFDELKRSTWELPSGRQKLAVLEEMIRIADRYMTEEQAYDARIGYLSEASEAGCQEKLLVIFAWCLAKFEQNPGDYSAHTLMWYYKWALNSAWQIPELTLAQVDSLFEDFREKCLRHGYSLRMYYMNKVNSLLSQGRLPEAAAAYKLWRTEPRDALADCLACERHMLGTYHIGIGHIRRGLQQLKPILEGQMSCRHIPQQTYGHIILPLLQLQEPERAHALARKALPRLDGPAYLPELGAFLSFYTVTNLSKAEKLYRQTIHLGLESRAGWDRLHYLLAVRQFLREWHRKKRRKRLAASDRVTIPWLDEQLALLAAAFDRRNGNDHISRLITDADSRVNKLIKVYRQR
ncbi:hypothetical protein [Paenibacillus sp. 1P07SE]|uniref:hypothetical protein n=1 Tax=Paenibacillus sp. 1P07SE TaxID=3132209 RepID=UPI0039A4F306